MSLVPLRQPPGSELCGQTCVAMAAGVTLDRACDVVGHRRATTTREIVRALRALGLRCANRLQRCSKWRAIPRRAIVHMRRDDGSASHWVLMWDGQIYDPDGGYPDPRWKLISYLEIYT